MPVTIQTWLDGSLPRLKQAGVDSARLDCLILLEDALGQDRSSILAHPEAKISRFKVFQLNNKVAQRAKHVPLAYLRGKAEFYGRTFTVSRYVLVPRPETEAIISLLLPLCPAGKPYRIADIGTGSGCLGITAALELPDAQVTLSDITPSALVAARANARKLGAKVRLRKANLLQNAPADTDIILANLPYVPTNYPINEAARHEPALALFSGEDGLDLYRRFWQELAKGPAPQHIITESLTKQHRAMIALAKKAGYRLAATDQLAQHFTRA